MIAVYKLCIYLTFFHEFTHKYCQSAHNINLIQLLILGLFHLDVEGSVMEEFTLF